MINTIHIVGEVVTTPRHLVTAENLALTSFRLLVTHDNLGPSYFTVQAQQAPALIAKDLQRGDKVYLQGFVHLREWDNGEMAGITAEIHPNTITLLNN